MCKMGLYSNHLLDKLNDYNIWKALETTLDIRDCSEVSSCLLKRTLKSRIAKRNFSAVQYPHFLNAS